MPFFFYIKKNNIAFAITFSYMRIHAHTYKQASKLFCFRSVFMIILLFTNHHPPPFLLPYTHIHYYMQHIIRAPFVLLALLLTSAFSLYILLLLQSPFAITYTADGDEHTHTKQSRAPYTHTHIRPL